jgi:GNAT superfamily N-acetyltransferase
MLDDLITREIRAEDALAAVKLSEELGYPVSPVVMKQRIESLTRLADHIVYVACLAGAVVGWIDVSVTNHLQSEPRAEIGGLVVSSEVRGSGIGHLLVGCAEQWARRRGLGSVIVRSQIAREAAHHFYLRQGYARTKTSAVFTKKLQEVETTPKAL